MSTRTYLNTLAISQVAAQILIPGGFSRSFQEIQAAATADLLQAADRVEDYLENRWVALDQIETFLNSLPPSSPPAGPLITLIGRGASLAAAYCGALYIQEAAKIPALGFQAGEFRHGPLEFASPSAGFWVFSGVSGTEASRINRKLFDELRSYGAPTRLLESAQGGSGQPASEGLLAMPAVSGLGLPLGEIVPIQLLSFRLAERQGILPGSFRHIGKITSVE